MSHQQFEQRHAQPAKTEEDAVFRGADTHDVDDILDQIDAVLDVNAEEFVRSFVQKGGQ